MMKTPIERAENARHRMLYELTIPFGIIATLVWSACLINERVATGLMSWAVLLTLLAMFFGAVSLWQKRKLRAVVMAMGT